MKRVKMGDNGEMKPFSFSARGSSNPIRNCGEDCIECYPPLELPTNKKYKNEGITVTGSCTGAVYYIRKGNFYSWELYFIERTCGSHWYNGELKLIESWMGFKKHAYDEIERLETEYQKLPAHLSRMLESGVITQAEYDKQT
tara:strand:+ start:14 stop:439 length:426 start_codon:yes stop_codon:yes gene_type:complete